MSPINKRLPREFKANLGKYLGIFLLLVLATSFTSGFLTSAASIKEVCDGIRATYLTEDFYFATMYKAKQQAIDDVEAMGARVYENFYRDVDLATPDSDADMSIRLFALRGEECNRQVYFEGDVPRAADEVAIDRVFAANHELSVGDTIRVAGEDMRISGIMSLSDHSVTYKTSGDFMFNAVTFTVGQVSDEAFARLVEPAPVYRYSVILNDRDMSLADRVSFEEDAVDAITDAGSTVTDLVDAESNIGLTFAPDDVEGDSTMWEVMLFIMIIVMAFVFVVLTSATIDQESAVIGTLLASGVRKRELLAHYMILPAIVGIAGGVVGNFIGRTWLTLPMKDLYYNSYSLPPFVLTWHWDIFVMTTIVPIVLLLVVTFIGLARRLKATPLQFLRHEASRKARRGGIALPEKLPFASRFRLRVFLRNFSHFATLFVGIMFGSILLLMALCLLPLVDYNADLMENDVPAKHLYTLKAQLKLDGTDEERTAWAAAEELSTDPRFDALDLDALEDADYSIIELYRQLADLDADDRTRAMELLQDVADVDADSLDNPVNQTPIAQETLDQVEKYAIASLSIQRRFGEKLEDVTVYGIQPDSRYWSDADVSGGRVLIGGGVLEKCDVALGEPIAAIDRYTNTDYTLTGADSYGAPTNMSIYMDIDGFNRLFDNDEDYFNGYISDEELPLDARYVASELTPQKMQEMSVQMQDSMGSMMGMLLYLVIPIYLVLIYLLTKTVIDRNARYISYMKVFGYRNREVTRLYVRAVTVTVLASLVLCLPLIQLVVDAIVGFLLSDYSGNLVMYFPPMSLVQVVLIGAATYLVVAGLHILRVRRVPLALAMKVQE